MRPGTLPSPAQEVGQEYLINLRRVELCTGLPGYQLGECGHQYDCATFVCRRLLNLVSSILFDKFDLRVTISYLFQNAVREHQHNHYLSGEDP